MIAKVYWVIRGRFLAGVYPGALQEAQARSQINWLMQQGADYFIDLTEAGEANLLPYEKILYQQAASQGVAVSYQRMPIQDFSTPTEATLRGILDNVDRALITGRCIYLHCLGGVGRTGTVVGCYLVHHGMSGEDALRQVSAWRGVNSPETFLQQQMVLNWKD